MSDLRYIFKRADKLMQEGLKKELRAQGHFNSGSLESSFVSNITVTAESVVLTGSAFDYAGILSDGTRPEKASMKQFHFVKQFFLSKGVDDKKAGAFAAMTIRKWMKEGMSTKASVRFSKNGKRLNFINIVNKSVGPKVDKVVLADVDKEVKKEFNKTKPIKI